MSTFRPATIADYVAWLSSYLDSGRPPTHFYDYPMSSWPFLVAEADFRMGGECGAYSVSIIVPSGILHSGDRGHNNLFLADGPVALGGIVPVFSDAEFEPLGLGKFIEAEQRRHAEFEASMRDRMLYAEFAATHSDIGRHLGRRMS